MKQAERVRKMLENRGQWMSIGVTAATLLTPMVKRWSDLRAAERTRSLRDEAELRLRTLRDRLPARPAQSATQELLERMRMAPSPRKVSSKVWLAGVSIGVLAAGAGTFWYVRRRMEARLDAPLLELPVTSANGHLRPADEGAALEVAATAPNPDEPEEVPTALEADAPDTTMKQTEAAPEADHTGEAEPPAEDDDRFTQSARFIGNIRTMVYHEATAENLPLEENRIYFVSEDDAREAGFHRDRDEISAVEGEQQ